MVIGEKRHGPFAIEKNLNVRLRKGETEEIIYKSKIKGSQLVQVAPSFV